MRGFVAGMIFGLGISATVAFAANRVAHKGKFWTKMTRESKISYVDGYYDAMRVSTEKVDVLEVAADLFRWRGAAKILRQLERQLSTDEFTANQAVERLDTLYSNDKYSELDLPQALETMIIHAEETEASGSKGSK